MQAEREAQGSTGAHPSPRKPAVARPCSPEGKTPKKQEFSGRFWQPGILAIMQYGALCLYQIIVPSKIRMKSRLVISLSNTSCSVDDCAQTENLCSRLEAVLARDRFFLSRTTRTGSSRQERSLCRSQSASKMYDFVAAGAPFFTFLPS